MRTFVAWIGTLLLAVTVSAANAAGVYYQTAVSHDVEIATAAGKLAASLGTTATPFTGTGDSTWSGVLGSASVVLLGQDAGSASISASTRTNIGNWVKAGGRLIVLWDDQNLALINGVMGASMTWISGGSTGNLIPRTAAGSASAYASTVTPLTSASNHGGIVTSSIPGSALNAYELTGVTHVMSAGVESGSVSFLSWDWCCGDTGSTRAEWDAVMLVAARFSGEPPAGVPTLSEWSLFVLSTLLATGAFLTIRRRKV